MAEVETGRIHYSGPYDLPVKATDVLCGDLKRRTVRLGRYPDTFFSIPGSVRVSGKSIGGYVTHGTYENASSGELVEVLEFRPYLYGKNGNVLPPLPESFSKVEL